MATRSSLELMLDRLQQLENDQSKDEIPALPVRPVSRARRPASRPLTIPLQIQVTYPEENGFFQSQRSKHEMELLENSDGIEEKRIFIIQKFYRGHQVRCYYKQLRRGVIALQSFVRGENARRDYHYRSKRPNAVKLDHIQVHYSVIIDLQKHILRTEAKIREKNEENIALKTRIQENEKKWRRYEERMKILEKAWQDELISVQKCLAASKRNQVSAIQIRRRYDSTQADHKENGENKITTTGIPNGSMDSNFVNHSINHKSEEVCDDEESEYSIEVVQDQFSNKIVYPHKELQKLKLKFKEWKKDYKNKMREAQSTFKKLSHSEGGKGQKYWCGRFSH